MNALIAPQSTKCGPFNGHTRMGVPLCVATDILNKDSQSGCRPSVVSLDVARGFLPPKHQNNWRFSVVWFTEFQLRALAGLVSIVPRFASLTELVNAPRLRGVVNITDDMLRSAMPRIRARPPGYLVVLRELSPERQREARMVAKHLGLKEVGLSLTSATTVALFSSIVLKQPWHEMHSTKTLSSSGKHFAVGPGHDGRVTVTEVWPNECSPALEFTQKG